MSLTEQFFDSLMHQNYILGNSPFLDANSQRGLESSYFVLHNMVRDSVSRQSKNRHHRARQHLKNIYSIGKPLLVLVAVTISITDLASLDHKEIFPRLAEWWQSNTPSQNFESRAIELIHELDNERERGSLVHLERRTKGRTLGKPQGAQHKRVETNISHSHPTPQESPIDQLTESRDFVAYFDHDKAKSGLGESLSVSGRPDPIESSAVNLTAEEQTFSLPSQLVSFIRAHHADSPHLQAFGNLLQISGPSLRLSYPRHDLAHACIHLNLQLASDIKVL